MSFLFLLSTTWPDFQSTYFQVRSTGSACCRSPETPHWCMPPWRTGRCWSRGWLNWGATSMRRTRKIIRRYTWPRCTLERTRSSSCFRRRPTHRPKEGWVRESRLLLFLCQQFPLWGKVVVHSCYKTASLRGNKIDHYPILFSSPRINLAYIWCARGRPRMRCKSSEPCSLWHPKQLAFRPIR